MSAELTAREEQARQVFSSAPPTGDPAELLKLALGLRDEENNIEYARRVLEVARQLLPDGMPGLRFAVLRALVVCTYKSPDQPLDRRLNEATALAKGLLQELENAPDGGDTGRRQDMLGILGSIYKLRWSAEGLRDHLENSLAYYRKGMQVGIEHDNGYTAINVAFVLDLLAAAGADSSAGVALKTGAETVRKQVRDTLLRMAEADSSLSRDFWFLATLGEAHLGLREFAAAEKRMQQASQYEPSPWQLESTARQTAKLAG
jgi:hypothetical protein